MARQEQHVVRDSRGGRRVQGGQVVRETLPVGRLGVTGGQRGVRGVALVDQAKVGRSRVERTHVRVRQGWQEVIRGSRGDDEMDVFWSRRRLGKGKLGSC